MFRLTSASRSLLLPAFLLVLCSCKNENPQTDPPPVLTENELAFDPDNGSIRLPDKFRAVVVADALGQARHLAVNERGDVYVNLGSPKNGKGLVALRDTTGNGVADIKTYFGRGSGTEVRLHQGYLYYSTNDKIYRHQINGDELVPSGSEELILSLPSQSQHAAKAFDFDGQGNMYVVIGAPSNACQDPGRTPGVPGQDPCPLLQNSGGIWQFSDSQPDQHQADGTRYATGIRHSVGMCWNQTTGKLYAMQHGRDQLHQFWPQQYTEKQSAELPAEEMFEIEANDNFGWPYCYYDQQKGEKLLNPEYGGDGNTVGRCDQYKDPIMAFPGHWAPNGLTFYGASAFPAQYREGAFIAFHGSWNRAPEPQQGYKVVFVPFAIAAPTGQSDDFATRFAGDGSPIASPAEAEYRPCGVAVGPDGSLYICDSQNGRVWRVVYTG